MCAGCLESVLYSTTSCAYPHTLHTSLVQVYIGCQKVVCIVVYEVVSIISHPISHLIVSIISHPICVCVRMCVCACTRVCVCTYLPHAWQEDAIKDARW